MLKILKKIALFSFLLALLAGAVAFFYFEKSDFSEADIKVELVGVDEVKVGDKVEYKIIANNNSNIRLEDVEITFKYPETSIPLEEDEDKVVEGGETFRRVEKVGEMNPGEEVVVDFEAIILGGKEDEVIAEAWLNYRPQNLTATYEIERTKTGIITEVPINFEFDTPEQVEADEEFPFRVRYYSKMERDLKDLGIKINYPSGFDFVRSTPKGIEDNEWERETLGTNEGGVIEIFGKLQGEYGDIKGFEAELGVWKFNRFIPLQKIEEDILIPQPNLFVDISVNDSTNYVANPGEDLLYDIYFKNIGDEVLENLFLTVDLDKAVMDLKGIEPMGGRFQEEAGSIIWSHSSFSDLRRLRPDEERKLSFWSRIKEEDLGYNPEALIVANLGKTIQDKRVKVNTKINIGQEFINDTFLNSVGPLPFRLNRGSEYGVKWEVENYYNDLEDLILKATLPEGSSLVDREVPEGTELRFNENNNELIWDIKTAERGVGITKEVLAAYMKIRVSPEESVDSDMELISDIEARGRDVWTNEYREATTDSLTYGQLLEYFEVSPEDSREEIIVNKD
jgi:hypothetical protein